MSYLVSRICSFNMIVIKNNLQPYLRNSQFSIISSSSEGFVTLQMFLQYSFNKRAQAIKFGKKLFINSYHWLSDLYEKYSVSDYQTQVFDKKDFFEKNELWNKRNLASTDFGSFLCNKYQKLWVARSLSKPLSKKKKFRVFRTCRVFRTSINSRETDLKI